MANLRDNIEWIKINSKGKDFIINLYSNTPKLYKSFIEELMHYSKEDGLDFFPESVILCPFNKEQLRKYTGKKMIDNPLVKKIVDIVSSNKLDLENNDYRQSKNNNIHFHKGLLNTEPYNIHVCVIYSLLNFFQGLEYLVPEDVNLKGLEKMCKDHCLNLIKVLKIPESFFDKKPMFLCLKNVHNEDLTITAQERTNSLFSMRSGSNMYHSPISKLSPHRKFGRKGSAPEPNHTRNRKFTFDHIAGK